MRPPAPGNRRVAQLTKAIYAQPLMTQILLPEILDLVRSVETAYHRLVIIAGLPGSGKTRLLKQVAGGRNLPTVNLSLVASQRLLDMTRRQRSLKAQEVALDVIDEGGHSGLCIDNTEILFDSSLRLNPLSFFQDISRNRLIIATWNGILEVGALCFGYAGHPDFFKQPVSGFPVVNVAGDKLQLHLAS